jgi:hypothetical protein
MVPGNARLLRRGAGAVVGLAIGALAAAYVVQAAPHPGFCPCSVCAGQTEAVAETDARPIDNAPAVIGEAQP